MKNRAGGHKLDLAAKAFARGLLLDQLTQFIYLYVYLYHLLIHLFIRTGVNIAWQQVLIRNSPWGKRKACVCQPCCTSPEGIQSDGFFLAGQLRKKSIWLHSS